MSSKIKNLVWDLSGTIFKANQALINQTKIESYSLLLYFWLVDKKASKLDNICITIFNNAYNEPKYKDKAFHNNKPLPELISAWLSGDIDGKLALSLSHLSFNKLLEAELKFLNNHEKNIILASLETFFNPYAIANCMQALPSTIEIIKNYRRSSLFILSNWDLESFNILYNSPKGQETFKYFNKENILISGFVHSLKPIPEIYNIFFNKYNLNPESCFFIDDQRKNIETAASLGMSGMKYNPDESYLLKDKLTEIL